jgi:hypothetical protein
MWGLIGDWYGFRSGNTPKRVGDLKLLEFIYPQGMGIG